MNGDTFFFLDLKTRAALDWKTMRIGGALLLLDALQISPQLVVDGQGLAADWWTDSSRTLSSMLKKPIVIATAERGGRP